MSDGKNLLQIGNPRFCDIVITNRCLLQCKMCKAWQCGPQPHELTFDDAKKFVQSLSEFVKEPLEINVMGGEPLWKDWCLDLCSFISQKGFKSIISTNAYLIDEDMAKRIADSGLDVLAISLESLNPSTHNYLRGKQDVLSKAMKAIEYLEKYCKRLNLTILTIIMEKNLDEILELTEWVNKNKAIQNISFLALLETGLVQERHHWFKSEIYKELWPQDTGKVHRLIDELIRLRRSGYKIWNPISQLEAMKEYYVEPDQFMRDTPHRVHDYVIDLDETGTIYLSGDVLGNVRENNVRELWFSDKANGIRKKIDTQGPGRRCCVINFICAFPPDDLCVRKEPLAGSQDVHTAGFHYLDQGEFGKAAEEFNRILKLDPQNAHARHGLGLCYQREGKFNEAAQEFRRGLEKASENEHIHTSLGFCYKELGQIDKAMDEFKRALALNPKNQNGNVGLGFCYLAQKKLDDAKAEFHAALALCPQSEFAHQGLGLCYQREGKFNEAAEEFRRGLEISPENEHIHHSLGFCYKDLEQLDKAIGEFQKALNLNPKNQIGYVGLGFCYLEQKEFDEAIVEFNAAVTLCPQNESAHQGLGSCYQHKGQFGKAADEFKRALALNPDNYQAHEGLAYSYERHEQFEAAAEEFNWLLKVQPNNEHYHMGLGCCYEGLRQFQKAVDHFNRALEIDPNIEGVKHCIASCNQSLRQQRRE